MNVPTIVVGLIVLAIFAAVLFSEIRKRKSGKGGCGCGCGGCAMSELCHREKE